MRHWQSVFLVSGHKYGMAFRGRTCDSYASFSLWQSAIWLQCVGYNAVFKIKYKWTHHIPGLMEMGYQLSRLSLCCITFNSTLPFILAITIPHAILRLLIVCSQYGKNSRFFYSHYSSDGNNLCLRFFRGAHLFADHDSDVVWPG